MSRPTNMKTKTKFGTVVCNRLFVLGKTQKELAQESNISIYYVNSIVQGKCIPSIKVINSISKSLGIGIDELTKALLEES